MNQIKNRPSITWRAYNCRRRMYHAICHGFEYIFSKSFVRHLLTKRAQIFFNDVGSGGVLLRMDSEL